MSDIYVCVKQRAVVYVRTIAYVCLAACLALFCLGVSFVEVRLFLLGIGVIMLLFSAFMFCCAWLIRNDYV